MVVELIVFGIAGLIGLFLTIRIVRPNEAAIVERLGKYNRILRQGLNFVIPFIDATKYIDLTENIVEAGKQEVITQDNLNAVVDVQIYYKVKSDDESLMKTQYAVSNYEYQIVKLFSQDIIYKVGCTLSN